MPASNQVRFVKKPLVVAVVASTLVCALTAGFFLNESSELSSLRQRALDRMSPPLVRAPGIDRFQASTAVSLFERIIERGVRDPQTMGTYRLARAIEDLQRGDLRLAEGELRTAANILGATTMVLWVQGSLLSAQHQTARAGQLVRSALGRYPEDERLSLLMSDILAELDQPGEAARLLGVVRHAHPRISSLAVREGLIAEQLNSFAEAEHAYREAIRLDERSLDGHLNLARTLRMQGNHLAALSEFDRSLALSTASADATLGRGLCLTDLGRLDEAEPVLRRAAELAPNDAEPLVALGDLYRNRAGQYVEGDTLRAEHLNHAIETYREGISRESADAVSWFKLGLALVMVERFRDAEIAYLQAVDRAPDFSAAHNGLGVARMRQGRNAEALVSFARAHTLDDADPNPRLNTFLVLQSLMRRTEARMLAEEIRARWPELSSVVG